jgi:hypothetical protein
MTRIEFWNKVSQLAARIDKALDPKPPYRHKAGKFVDKFVVADSRIRLAIYAAWLALRGDQVFYQRWEARHIHGVERYVQDHAREKQRVRLVAAAELAGDRQLKEELGAAILRNKAQAREIRNLQESAERRNRDLAALHIVWCDGGCPGGVGSPETLDRPTVLAAVLSVRRLVSWWNNRQYRDGGHKPTSEDYLRERVDFESPAVQGD